MNGQLVKPSLKSSSFGRRLKITDRVPDAINLKKIWNKRNIGSCNASFRIFASIAERRSQCRTAAFVVVGVFAVVDGRIDGNGPHTGGVTVAIAIVIFAPVARSPDENVT
uniref:Uncharacterized protein n=1 Tax=Romanomermis culicivorax TaxID=13658 RepID=A0A915KKR9_ROMCU